MLADVSVLKRRCEDRSLTYVRSGDRDQQVVLLYLGPGAFCVSRQRDKRSLIKFKPIGLDVLGADEGRTFLSVVLLPAA